MMRVRTALALGARPAAAGSTRRTDSGCSASSTIRPAVATTTRPPRVRPERPTAGSHPGLCFRPTNPLPGAAPVPGRSRPKGGGMTRRYETVYIFDSALEEPAITERLDKFHALLTKDGKGSVTNVAHWGKRTLAFPIKKRDSGHYVVAQFETAADLLPEYERAVKLDEGVLRYLVVVSEGLPARPEAAPAVVPAEVDEIEEEEA